MNGSPAVDEAGTIYGTATFAGMGSSAFAMGSDGVEKWRTPWAMSARWIKAVL